MAVALAQLLVEASGVLKALMILAVHLMAPTLMQFQKLISKLTALLLPQLLKS